MKSYLYIIIAAIVVFASCNKNDAAAPGSSNGTAGSLARFAMVGDYLYTVTESNIKIFDVNDEKNPIYKADQQFGTGIETIFPLGNTLFIGSENGMYIYDVTDPLLPRQESVYTHILSCDPVVANDKFAYVTLNTGATRCFRGLNQLEIIDISNKTAPRLLQTLPMVQPKGMALSGNNLFVCDDKVKWFDATNSPTLTPKGIINVKAHDAIAIGNILMLVGENGLQQYDFSGAEAKFLSQINIGKL